VSELPPFETTAHPLAADDGWQPLPTRGAWLDAGVVTLSTCLPFLVLGGTLAFANHGGRQPWIALLAVPVAALTGWLAYRRQRRMRWRLDAQGLAVRRGNLWRHEIRVPASRVQHLDLKRGPLERWCGLSTLVVHTAGTRQNAVTVPGLDHDTAEHLRDRLARQLDQDDDAL
jgi:membrane protein YdbS with pleckstrin-like domain